jgi:hypothetical protein
MKRAEILRALALFVFFALAFLLSTTCQARNWQAKTDAALDSAAVAQTRAEVNAALAKAAETRANVAANERRAAQDSARRAIAEANRLRAQRRVITPVASQPGAAPTVSDTLTATRAALENCESETSALRATIAQDSTAATKSTVTEAELRGALALSRESAADLSRTVDMLTDRLRTADPPCRVLFWGCPSRTQVAVGTAVVTVVLTRALTR